MNQRCTVMIGEFTVSQANALSDGLFLSAVPPLTAWVGLVTALSFRLGKNVRISVAPVIGEADLHRGHPRYVRYRHGQLSDVSSRGIQHPTIDDRRTSLNAYLLLDMRSEDSISKSEIAQALIGLRLAGGVIQPCNGKQEIPISIFHYDADTPEPHKKALRYLPSYFYLIEDASRLVKAAHQQNSELKGFDILTAPMRRWEGAETETEKKQHLHLPPRPEWLPSAGYYRPMAVAYQLLEQPQSRTGVRHSLDGEPKHAFAETVYTLIRFRTVASIRKHHRPRRDGHYFWQQTNRTENILGAKAVSPTQR